MGSEWSGKLEPMAGKVILKFSGSEDTYVPGGKIVVPDSHKIDQDEATVLAVGPAKIDANGNFIQPPVKVGDRVLSNPAWGKDYRWYDADRHIRQVVIVGYDSIIARIND